MGTSKIHNNMGIRKQRTRFVLFIFVLIIGNLQMSRALSVHVYGKADCRTKYFYTCGNPQDASCCVRPRPNGSPASSLRPYYASDYYQGSQPSNVHVGYRSNDPASGCSSPQKSDAGGGSNCL